MHRRKFLTAVSIASTFPFLYKEAFANSFVNPNENIIKPPKLKFGDTVGLIAPGSNITEDELNESVKNLEALGFKVVYRNDILAKHGYLAGTDERRASEINEMFNRKDVSGIICARGGYGCARILHLIDYQTIKQNPKIIIGYSDITALLYAIFQKTGLVTFHGPVGISTFNNFSKQNFADVLLNPSSELILWNAKDENENNISRKSAVIRSGKATGKMVGGNLSIVVSMIGTEYDIDTSGKIIFLEEVGEEPYRVDRMLTQMIQAGKFSKAAGIALGVFEKCEPKEKNAEFNSSFSLTEVLFDRLFNLGIPVLYGMSFGHITNKFTLPLGVTAQLNVDDQTLTLLETAVH
ncbi:MAG: LD-carboxypeptidase [Ignavibacteriales bacterium]|nr:LD-carboxypeptidase [Ignavibacteriales bacterium]